MSTDQRVTKDLITTLENGKLGFAQAADRLGETDRKDLSARFTELSAQRGQFASELQTLAASYGDDIEESGSIAGAAHRGWMAVKDALAGSNDAEGVLDAAEQGEDHAVAEYESALKAHISPELRTIVERQSVEVRAAHDEVRAARDSAASTN